MVEVVVFYYLLPNKSIIINLILYTRSLKINTIYDLIFETVKNPGVYPGRVGVKNPGGVGVTIFAGVLTPPGSGLG